MFLISAGKLFQTLGAAALNDLSPKVAKNLPLGRISVTAICVQAQTANIFARLFTFETGRLPLETECFTAHVTCHIEKP